MNAGRASLHPGPSRRSFLKAGLAIGAVGLTAACATTTGGPPSGATRNADLPKFQAFTKAPKPDLPGDSSGVLNGYLHYPAQTVTIGGDAPGRGSKVTALLQNQTPPPPVDRNRYWQELNKRLNIQLDFIGAPAPQYNDKLQVTLAGGEIPDVVQMPSAMPHLPQVLQSQFSDLSEFLAGDAVLDYPALAAIPTTAWRNVIFNGGVYGVPYPLDLMGSMLYGRADTIKEKGLSTTPASSAEFKELCRALTDPAKNTWALGGSTNTLFFACEMFGAPNDWREENGKLTHQYEAAETKEALAFVKSLWDDGLFHPDAFTGANQRLTWFNAGTIGLIAGSASSWSTTTTGIPMVPITQPNADGSGQARKYLTTGSFTFAALKKAPADRVEELLRILNWLAAPFGTTEQMLIKFGLPDVHYHLDGTDPIGIPDQRPDLSLPVYYMVSPPPVFYTPTSPNLSRDRHAYYKKLIPNGIQSAVVGLTSETDQTKGAQLTRAMSTTIDAIVQGHTPLADWDAAVQRWRADGGDTIRNEYQDALHTQ